MSDYPPPGAARLRTATASTRLGVAAVVTAVAGAVAGFLVPWQAAPNLAWAAGSLSWSVWTWVTIVHLDPVATSEHATREDPNRTTADLLLLGASAASLVAVALVFAKAGHTHGDLKVLLLTVSTVSVVSSWLMVHTLFTLRYAALYYTGPDGGIDFNEDDKPCYRDFAYLAFTVGMTYQVSDTNLTSKEVRHTALRHGLLSFLFGTVIIASTINLVAGLAK